MSEKDDENLLKARRAVSAVLSKPPTRRYAAYTREDEAPAIARYAGPLRMYPSLEGILPWDGGSVACTREGLERLDEVIRDRKYPVADIQRFSQDVALYYGDTVLVAVSGAYWIIEPGRFPRVQITAQRYIDMFEIAMEQVLTARPFLCEKFDRLVQSPGIGGGIQ
ncbi:DUF6278 family protein [Arthrobacter sp. CC3]|uniref:DUF6278 family protein n=1 Tax=Arthrobacter sp. CC3 TaxID=3029185 RepID=UPI00326754F9